jgi:hypothetical protein
MKLCSTRFNLMILNFIQTADMGTTGVIRNSSLLTIQYLIHNVEEPVIQDTQRFDTAHKFSTNVDDVIFGGFHKIDDVVTAPIL